MVEFYQKQYLYFDHEILCDSAILELLEELASKHYQMYVYAHDQWELEEIKTLKAYAYICDCAYGETMEQAVKDYAFAHGQKIKKVVMLQKKMHVQHGTIASISLPQLGFDDVRQFLTERRYSIKKRARKIYGILAASVIYFLLYFLMLEHLPLFMQDGIIGLLFVLIPVSISMVAFSYGLYSELIHWSVLWELLDIF